MNINESAYLLKQIMNDKSEYRPSIDSKKWTPYRNYKIFKSYHKTYEITPDLITIMNNYTKLYKRIKNYIDTTILDKYDDNIAIIYVIENKRTNDKYIGYTTYPLIIFIKYNIHNYNMKTFNIFTKFNESDIKWLNITLLEYVCYKDKTQIDERKSYYTDLLIRTSEKSSDENTIMSYDPVDDLNFLFEERIKNYLNTISDHKNKLVPFYGYIYMLINKQNNKIYIGGTLTILDKKTILKQLEKNNILLDDKLELLYYEKYYAFTMIEFMLRIDYHKIKYNSIKTGYNTDYLLDVSPIFFADIVSKQQIKRIQQQLFTQTQLSFFEQYFKDNTNYKDNYGYVYEITHTPTNKKYFGYTTNTKLHDEILQLYNNPIKSAKMHKALTEYSYFDFKFHIVKTKSITDTTTDLHNETLNLIAKYNTTVDGFNTNETKKKATKDLMIII